jgi:hypothetical protein
MGRYSVVNFFPHDARTKISKQKIALLLKIAWYYYKEGEGSRKKQHAEVSPKLGVKSNNRCSGKVFQINGSFPRLRRAKPE